MIVKLQKTCSKTTFCGILNRDVRLYVVNLLVTFVAVPLLYISVILKIIHSLCMVLKYIKTCDLMYRMLTKFNVDAYDETWKYI